MLMRNIIIIFIVFFLSECSREKDQITAENEHNLKLVSDVQLTGFQSSEPLLITEFNALRNYTKGNQGLYLSYGFEKLLVRKYKNRNSLSIASEVYLLNSSKNAYGLYSFDTTGKKLDIGQDAVYSQGILRFWKDRLFVRIFAIEEHEMLEKHIMLLAKQMDSNISMVGLKPNIINVIPKEKLMPDSIHFFHTNLCFNNIYYIPESSKLNLSQDTEVVCAQYNLGYNHFPRLVIISYSDENTAGEAFNNFKEAYFDEQSYVSQNENSYIVKNDEGKYESMTLHNEYIILTFESKSSVVSKELTDKALTNVSQSG